MYKLIALEQKMENHHLSLVSPMVIREERKYFMFLSFATFRSDLIIHKCIKNPLSYANSPFAL